MSRHNIFALLLVGISMFSVAGDLATADDGIAAKKTPSELMPITSSNLRGHESLYREGWFVVSSTEKALEYARENAVSSSWQAMTEVRAELARHTDQYGTAIVDAGRQGMQTGVDIAAAGTANTKRELVLTGQLMQAEIDYGSRTMRRAWERFYKGNISLAQRTEEDRKALAALPGNYFRDLKSDFRNLHQLSESAKETMSSNIEGRWSEGFGEARAEFNESYDKSGTRGNSLSALFDIVGGYAKAFYAGLVKPAARSTVQGTEAVTKTAAKAVFLPVASLFIVTGRTVASAGMSLYYSTSAGIKLVSPTVEGGLLAGMSLLSYGAVPVTGAVGGAAGVVNQVAVSVAAPIVGTGHAVGSGISETVYYAAQVSYDLAKGTSQVTLNQAKAGISLGYNALTAVPTQLLLGAANGVVFLAWDGPRLVLATAKGEVQWRSGEGHEESVSVQSLPVGAVIDLDALAQESGVTVEVISDDPEVVQQVLEKLPQDLRLGGKS